MTLLDEPPRITDDSFRSASSEPVRELTTCPPPPAESGRPQIRRQLRGVSRNDLRRFGAALISSFCTTLLIFGRLTPLSGKLGFTIVFFGIFLATYALIVSLDDDGPAVVDKVMTTLLAVSGLVALAALTWVVVYVVYRGINVIWRVNLYTQDMATAGPLQPLSEGGSAHAIVGTLIIVGISLVLTVPLGVTCAVYLNETNGRFTELVRSVVTAMTALPSIIAGLFVFAFWVLTLGFPRSDLAASLAISIMMLPIIIRSADVVLRLVPGNLREASAALGAPQWRTVWHVVLPTARSGLATSVILGVARGVGETAPVLLVSGLASSMNVNPLQDPMTSLPLAVYNFVRSGNEGLIRRGFGTGAVLMILVLGLFALARVLGGRPAGHMSNRQRRKAARRSTHDLERIEAMLVKRPVTTAPLQLGNGSGT